MRLLLIGGTRFAGRFLTEAALARGHQVTLFHRGITNPDLFPGAEHRHGDRNADLSALDSGEWDATVDFMAYAPRDVQTLAKCLAGRGGHYTLISTVAVYRHPAPLGGREDAPLIELPPPVPEAFDRTAFGDPNRQDHYGGMKVLCERAAEASFHAGVLSLRPTFMIGPHDPTLRFNHWVNRIARGGEVLAPGPRDSQIQTLDARDFAAFALDQVERRATRTMHVAAPQPPTGWDAFLEALVSAVGPPGTRLTWVDRTFLQEHGVTDQALPFWRAHFADATGYGLDCSAALAAGLAARPLANSARDVLASGPAQPAPPGGGTGTPDGREAELLALWRASGK